MGLKMPEIEEKEISKTIFADAVNEFMAADGTLTPEEYEMAKKLAEKEAERRSHTLLGEFKKVYTDNKKKIVMWFVGLGTAITGAITVLFTDGALKIVKSIIDKV